VCFSCDEVPVTVLPAPTKVDVGLDVGISSLLTDSEGNKVENPKFFREGEKELRRQQRSLSRKKKGSKRRYKAKERVAKVNEKIVNQRRDFLSKIALLYLKVYQTIYIENLNIKGMVKNGHLSKSISDVAWGMFFEILRAKAASAGREVIGVNPRNTSQDCSGCGTLVPKKLSVRIHKCPSCGLVLDRDENAAINLVLLGRAAPAGAKLGVA
jgi:putative transposase